jgi:hypothetical protein
LLEKRYGELGQGNHDRPELGILLAEWEALVKKVTPARMNSQFIRYYLLMTHQDETIQTKRVYKHFRDMVSEHTANDVMQALKHAGTGFAEAIKPALIEDNSRRHKLSKVLENVERVGVNTARIALMPVLMYVHNNNQALKAAAVIESLAFRWIVCGMNAQDLETVFAKFAKDVHGSSGVELDRALERLKEQIPSDARFAEAFATADRKPVARYVLDKLEIALYGPDFGQAAHVEHIMPQTFSEPWADTYSNTTDYAELVYQWGNLTLLAREINWVAGNDGWTEKLRAYKIEENAHFPNGRQIKLTSALLDLPVWNEAAIKARQRWMAQLATLVWPEDGSYVSGAVANAPAIVNFLTQMDGDS